ncbi:hypothetical protein SAMN04487968_103236 [Nocardioides terrae]|uniref:Uncharacterized protein n=1 Tax=Nocardioides terrae TaxID=574651 RepID=A0A1I1G2P2_9ACTN|nr:hypothetical protein [Nocardioides terrae]SFC06017.1 hypothetical protein SAMN04487968_103236 [Nocardioides terrae]
MTGSDQGPADGQDRIGSAAEEAAKLLGALSGWAGDLGHGLGANLDAHLDTGAQECAYCPICRTVHVLREASPELKVHLASAAASLMQAAASVLAAAGASNPATERSAGVERIDLDSEGDWPETDPSGSTEREERQ